MISDSDRSEGAADPVEQAAIQTAMQYAVVNGYADTDRQAVGLVLAGMAIAARCSAKARAAIATGYRTQHPNATWALDAWVAYLNSSARLIEDPTPSEGGEGRT